jgi:hypothetical protein
LTLPGRRRAREIAVLLTLFAAIAAMTSGCSWLVGVSDDPVVVDGTGGNDAGDEDAPPE